MIRRRRTIAPAAVALLLGTLAAGATGPRDLPAAASAHDPLARLLEDRRAAVARAPGDPAAWSALGDLQALLGRSEEAEASYRRLLELEPAAGHYRLGRLWSQAGRGLAARRELGRALDLDPTLAGAHYELGVLYDGWDFDRIARRHFARAFALDPSLADPTANPYLEENRQALSALVAGWESEAAPSIDRSAVAAAPSSAASPPPAGEPSGAPADPGVEPAAGGYARATPGAARAVGEPVEPPASLDAGSLRPTPRADSEPTDRVLDSRSLGGGSVNQVVAPGFGERGGSRGSRDPSSRGRSMRPPFDAPQPPREPSPRPFEPSPDSTGRIERGLDASDPGRFALGERDT